MYNLQILLNIISNKYFSNFLIIFLSSFSTIQLCSPFQEKQGKYMKALDLKGLTVEQFQ